MKKRRVLALLLALSLAVSMNDMTVLATAPDAVDFPVTAGADNSIASEGERTVDTQKGNDSQQPKISEEEEQPDDQGNAGTTGSETGSGTTDNTSGADSGTEDTGSEATGDEGGQNPGSGPEDHDNSGDQSQDDGMNEDDPTGQPSADEDGAEADGEDPDGEGNPEDTVSGDTENVEENGPEAEVSVSDNTLEEETETHSTAVRMMSFTDEVGMVVTYNAAAEYRYTVDENGTLTAIKTKNGEDVTGNVVLAEDQGIKRIAQGAFTGNTGITYISMPAGVTSIGENAFKGCTSLKGMTIPTGVTVIEASAFEGCSGLTQFALPATVTSIGNRAFYGDARLFMVYMRNSDISRLQSIGDYAFYGCGALTDFCSDMEFVFPDGMNSIGEYAFCECKSINSVKFPENVTAVGSHAFASCSALAAVYLPKALNSIPQYAFAECHSLITVEFVSGNQTRTIESYAFKSCYRLASVELSFYVHKIAAYAFMDCSGLKRVKIPDGACEIEDNAFDDVSTLFLISPPGSEAEKYTKTRDIGFIAMDVDNPDKGSYQWDSEITGSGRAAGTIEVYTSANRDPANKVSREQKVQAGTELYVWPIIRNSNESKYKYRLVAGSLKCNGTAIEFKDGNYVFKMPSGGAMITAEIETVGDSTGVEGTDVTYELSNGANLKIGQTTRMFLLDADNHIIPSSKVTYKVIGATDATVASVSKDGVITALKEGTAHVRATVTGINEREIKTEILIVVSKTDVSFLTLTASSFDRDIFGVTEKVVGGKKVQTVSANKVSFSKNEVTLQLKAQAYDQDEDAMAIALKWSTSDTSVAKLSKTSTANADPFNMITIPKDASGEATITVTATNANKKNITQKFIIQVMDRTPRLSSSAITLNLDKEEGAVFKIISSYGSAIDPDTVKLVYAKNTSLEVPDFERPVYDREGSSNGVYKYIVNAKDKQIAARTYSIKVMVNNDEKNAIPLNITVKALKSSIPNPKVTFDKKQPRINLFYANDGTEIKPVITKLGTEKIQRYSLEPLTDKTDDKLFTENFQIDEETGIITQKNENIVYSSKNKLISTGYLVLHFEGYKEDAVRRYKITIPTQTVKPSYKLDKTSDVYNVMADERTVVLSLIDSKTKKQVVLDDTDWTIDLLENADCVSRDNVSIDGDGRITMVVNSMPSSGNVVLAVRNNDWAKGQEFKFTYKIKTTTAAPKIKLKTATVNLNKRYTEQVEAFSLVSNQCDTILADEQHFTPSSTSRNAVEYEKLNVEYYGGEGTVSINDGTIKPGTYKFKSDPIEGGNGERYNAVTLTVKVTDTAPSMSVKGTASLNLLAVTDGNYAETAEMKLNVKLPEGYAVDEIATVESIRCTAANMSEIVNDFNWEIRNDVLFVSLNNPDSPVPAGTYNFTMTPEYSGADGGRVTGKAAKFKVKVYRGAISVKLSAKGVLNLLDREGEYTLKNSIVFTPSFTNLKDTVEAVQIFDASKAPQLGDEESEYFRAEVLDGKIYVRAREGADLENKKTYPVRIWVKLANYGGYDGMWVPGKLNIKTAQVIPKVTVSQTGVDLYLSQKTYEAVFTVQPKEGSTGKAVDVIFGEKDTKSEESFEVSCEPQEDGTLEVRVRLKDTVSYPGNSTSKVTMYVMFEGQAVKTAGAPISMNIRINK